MLNRIGLTIKNYNNYPYSNSEDIYCQFSMSHLLFLIKKYRSHPLIRAALAPILFEMCGIVPLALVVFGVISISAGMTLRNTLVFQYGPIFFIIAAIFFIFGVYTYLKQKGSCSLAGVKKQQRFIVLSFLLLSLLEAAMLLFLQITEKLVYGVSLSYFYEFFGFAIFLAAVLALFAVGVKFVK